MMLKNKIENKIMRNILRIEQKTVIPFIYVAIILVGLDLITTSAGIRLGFNEENRITLILVNTFGILHGLLISIIGKAILIILPFIMYEFINKELDTLLMGIPLKNIYWILYMIIVLIAIMTTLATDITNTMAIMNVVK